MKQLIRLTIISSLLFYGTTLTSFVHAQIELQNDGTINAFGTTTGLFFLNGAGEQRGEVFMAGTTLQIESELSDIVFQTANNNRMTIKNNGDVGIGTDPTLGKLHIEGATSDLLYLQNTTGDARHIIDGVEFSGITLRNDGLYKSGIGYSSRPNEDYFFVFEGGTNSIVSKSGDVGISTTNPTAKLDIRQDNGGSNLDGIRIFTNVGSGRLWFDDATESFRIQKGSGNDDQLVLAGNGNVGIGTTAPTARLEVKSNSDDIAIFSRLDDGQVGLESGGIKIDSDLNQYLTFEKRGTSPGSTDFEFVNTGGGLIFYYSNSDFSINREGLGSFNGGGATYQFSVFGSALASGGNFVNSDKRLKKNIQPIKNSIEKIVQLQPKSYEFDFSNKKFEYLNLPQESQFGFLAQELEQIFPNLVKTDSTASTVLRNSKNEIQQIDNLKSINYAGFVPVLIAAIQEQQAQLEEKEAEIEALKTKVEEIDDLKARLAKLEALLTQNTTPANAETTVHLQGTDQPRLEQNAPNPFNGETQIQYYLPKTTTSAQLRITDANGQLLKILELQDTGEGQVTIKTSDLPSGSYQYTLIIDGKVFATRQMMLAK